MSIVCVAQYIALLFFFNDTATTEIYTLSLHDALPISRLEGTAVAARRLPSSQRGGNPPDRSGRRTRDPPTGGVRCHAANRSHGRGLSVGRGDVAARVVSRDGRVAGGGGRAGCHRAGHPRHPSAAGPPPPPVAAALRANVRDAHGDRKSTRLNSSHSQISYAVFCLKKK